MDVLKDRAYKIAHHFCLVAGEKDAVMRLVRVGGLSVVSLKSSDCSHDKHGILRHDFHFEHGCHVHMAVLGNQVIHCAIIDRLSLLDHGVHTYIEGGSFRHDVLPEDLAGIWRILDDHDGRFRSPAAPVLR